jgi:hypothetical protein
MLSCVQHILIVKLASMVVVVTTLLIKLMVLMKCIIIMPHFFFFNNLQYDSIVHFHKFCGFYHYQPQSFSNWSYFEFKICFIISL